MLITKDTIVSDILHRSIGAAQFFLEEGMNCFDCPSSKGETLEEACEIHGVNADMLLNKLNNYFRQSDDQKANL